MVGPEKMAQRMKYLLCRYKGLAYDPVSNPGTPEQRWNPRLGDPVLSVEGGEGLGSEAWASTHAHDMTHVHMGQGDVTVGKDESWERGNCGEGVIVLGGPI